MQKRLNQILVFLTIFAVVLTSVVTTKTAYADDGTNSGGGTSEPAAGGDGQPQVDATPQPEQLPADAGSHTAPAESSPVVVEQAAPADQVTHILAQIPEGTDVVAVSESGGVEPLATQAAAEIIATMDPMWCPTGQVPGDPGCTAGYADITTLIANLGSQSGSGTIFFTSTYSANDATLDQTNPNLVNLADLTIQGGWNGATGGGFALSGSTTFSGGPLNIVNWTGNVTLNDLIIDAEDSQAGLYVQTDGNISVNNVNSSGNSIGYGAGLDTCLYDSVLAQCTGTGNVDVQNSQFDNNTGGSGLGIDSGGTITIDNSQANSNGFAGAELYNYDLIGSGGVNISNSVFDSNGDNGIWVQSDGTINLTNTDATNNGFDGVDLLNDQGSGDVIVNGGDFSGNDDAGLYITSQGNVSLDSVNSTNNRDGAIIDNSYGSGDVDVTASTFSDNVWTGLSVTSAGNITVDNVTASNNSVVGAYLNALAGSGNVTVQNNSTFNGNGQWGLKAFAGDGDITLSDVSEDGSGGTYATETGAWLKSFNGSVFVQDSIFTNNQDAGLLAVAGGQVDLLNVTATSNGGDGVDVYSIYNFACFGNQDIAVTVDGGTYTGNDGYGIYAEPGQNDLTLTNSPVFAPVANGQGDTFVSHIVNPCPQPDSDDDSTGSDGNGDDQPSNEVEIPETGQVEPVVQDCENFSSTTLRLHTGTNVVVNCPFTGSSQLSEIAQDQLPGRLPVGLKFGSAVTIGLDSEGNPLTVMTEGGLLTLNFVVPEELIGKQLSILYWDPTAKDGAGDWIELPLEQFGGAYFPLYPDKPDDGRFICSGLVQHGNMVSVTVNFPGTFVLVAR